MNEIFVSLLSAIKKLFDRLKTFSDSWDFEIYYDFYTKNNVAICLNESLLLKFKKTFSYSWPCRTKNIHNIIPLSYDDLVMFWINEDTRKKFMFFDKRKSMRRPTNHRSVLRKVSDCQVRKSFFLQNIKFHSLIKQIIFYEYVLLLRVNLSFWLKKSIKIIIIVAINS